MLYTPVNKKYQVTIPKEVRKVIDLHEGDRLGFTITNGQVFIKKITPLDLEFAKALEGSLSEWLTAEDDEAYHDL